MADISEFSEENLQTNTLCQLTMKLSVLIKDSEEVEIMSQLNQLYKSSLIQLTEQNDQAQENYDKLISNQDMEDIKAQLADEQQQFEDEDEVKEIKAQLSIQTDEQLDEFQDDAEKFKAQFSIQAEKQQQLQDYDQGKEETIEKLPHPHPTEIIAGDQNQIDQVGLGRLEENFESGHWGYQIPQKLIRIQEIHKQYSGIKEGFLSKKSDGFVGLFEKKYFVLTNSRLFYFSDENKQKIQGVINFKVVTCSVSQPQEQLITIKIENSKKSFYLRAETNETAAQWFNSIQRVAQENKQRKTLIKTTNLQLYLESDSMTEEEFEDFAETGDILLFSTNNIGSKLQRGLTRSKYDHIGMVIKFQNQEIRVFDSSKYNGVALLRWYEFIQINDLYTTVTLRKLVYNRRYEIEPIIISFVGESLGRKYILNAKKLLKQQSTQERDSMEGYFCSELVAEAFKQCKLLDQLKSSSQYWPGDFSQEKQIDFHKGAKLSNEIMIILRKHRYI